MVTMKNSLQPEFLWCAPDRGVPLGPEIGRGGEARIHSIGKGLAKLYRPEVLRDAGRRRRLQLKVDAMCRLEKFHADPRYAWPLFSLYRDRACTEWLGFAMRRCPGVGLEVLGSLRTLQEYLPQWDRLAIAQAMDRLLDAVQHLADAGLIIGDIAPANFRVDDAGAFYCIDKDSYQLRLSHHLHRCPVLTQRYAPPEQINGPPSDIERTAEHLRFSMAVLVYECLTIGLHPYQRTCGDDPVANLKEGKTAMGGVRVRGWLPPVRWERYAALHPAVTRCCVQTFLDGHANPSARPTLEAWRKALQRHIAWLQQKAAA